MIFNKTDLKFIKDQLESFYKSFFRIFIYKEKHRKYTTKKILVANGSGYGNTGDEAQIDATLGILTKRYPDYQIISLTPKIEYSKAQRPEYTHDFASRVLFFNQTRNCSVFFINTDKSLLKRIVFILKSILIILNAYLVRADFPTFFVNARIAKYLYELKEGALLYFSGGGYLTGRTLSRLWDGALICKLADIFRLPVVMSGQTIGLWCNPFNKFIAKTCFKKVKIITVRDDEYSLKDLKEIGLEGDNYFPTHDDALFCKKSEEPQTDIQNYVTVNFHYWGIKDEEKNLYIDKINTILNYIYETTDYNLIFIPMHKSDKLSYDDFISKYPNDRFTCFEYDYDFKKVRRIIADSKICVTMKQHPIIFAMGETTPAIALNFSDYYVHKNVGALAQYKQEKNAINLENNNYFEEFKLLFNNVNNNYEQIQKDIKTSVEALIERKNKFLSLVDDVLKTN